MTDNEYATIVKALGEACNELNHAKGILMKMGRANPGHKKSARLHVSKRLGFVLDALAGVANTLEDAE